MSGVKTISQVKIAVIFDAFEKRRVQCSQGSTQTHTAHSHHSCHVSITWFELSSLPKVSGSEYLCVDCVLTIHC